MQYLGDITDLDHDGHARKIKTCDAHIKFSPERTCPRLPVLAADPDRSRRAIDLMLKFGIRGVWDDQMC
jgi:hypothetical protein